jgi:hypothetical protein
VEEEELELREEDDVEYLLERLYGESCLLYDRRLLYLRLIEVEEERRRLLYLSLKNES